VHLLALGPCAAWPPAILTRLIATHPLPPMRRAALELRDDQLRRLRQEVLAQPGPVVVLGDLDTSPWSRTFAELLEGTPLRDARRGTGVLPTWRATLLPVVPIDHVLVGPRAGRGRRPHRRDPRLGSPRAVRDAAAPTVGRLASMSADILPS